MFCLIGQMGKINCELFSVFLVALSANIFVHSKPNLGLGYDFGCEEL